MRVLLQSRSDLLARPGGDAVYVRALADQLRGIGVEAEVCPEATPALTGVDVVHVFNIVRAEESLEQVANANAQGIPVVCTPIYSPSSWLEAYEHRGGSFGLGLLCALVPDFQKRQRLKTLARLLRNGRLRGPSFFRTGYFDCQRACLTRSSHIVVDTRREAEELVRTFAGGDLPLTVAPLEMSPVAPAPLAPDSPPLPDRFVFCPARIEPLKNQLVLIEALEDTGLDLVFAGAENPWHPRYVHRFQGKIRASTSCHFVGKLDRAQIDRLHRRAAAVVVPSWCETSCLAALEGFGWGAPVVVSRTSYASEYLGDRADYCDPGDVRSIRDAVLGALARGRTASRPEALQVDWEAVARSMAAVYSRVCAESAQNPHEGSL